MLAVHTLPRTAKQQVIEQLYHHLSQPQTMIAIITQLDAAAKEAFRHLLAADSALPVYIFAARFGPIRSYRPWRKDVGTGSSLIKTMKPPGQLKLKPRPAQLYP